MTYIKVLKMNMNTLENEKIIFEYEMAKKIEDIIACPRFNSLRDVDIFCPQVYSNFEKESLEVNVDNTMAQDGILYMDTNKNSGCKYYIDTYTGLIYAYDGSYRVLYRGNFSSQFDVFDAAYFRQYIVDANFRNKMVVDMSCGMREILTLDYMGYSIKDIFTQPVLEYTANNKNELDEIIDDIKTVLSQSKFFRKLWFRGQRREYSITRSLNTLKKLGFPLEFASMPSLIPSIGRCITNENYLDLRNDAMHWMKAYKVWTLVQSDEYKNIFGIGTKGYKEIIQSIEKDKYAQYVWECPYDIEDYLFYQPYDERPSILTTQQYGGYSSMLDITDDIDVALFFTQSFLNLETMKFELCAPTEENIVYLFAEGRDTATIDISNKVFYSSPIDGIHNIPRRIENQKCGLLLGANIFAKNTYAYRIIAKIHLKNSNITTTKKICEMFPPKEEDLLFKTYSDIKPKLNGLYG